MAATKRRQPLTSSAIIAGGAALAGEAKGVNMDRTEWVAGLRDYEDAEMEARISEEAYGRARARWLAEKPHTDGSRDASEVDHAVQRSNDAADASAEALSRLLNIPAPDADALAWKIQHLFQPDHGDFAGAFAFSYIKQTLADAVRLAGGTPSGMLA